RNRAGAAALLSRSRPERPVRVRQHADEREPHPFRLARSGERFRGGSAAAALRDASARLTPRSTRVSLSALAPRGPVNFIHVVTVAFVEGGRKSGGTASTARSVDH